MATTPGDTINALYLAYYGRPADPAGLAYWTAVLETSKNKLDPIVNAFATSAEATARFGSESLSDRINDIYQQLFGRAAEKSGLDYWVKTIESGQLSIANAALEIMKGAQSGDAQTSNLRQQVAAQFTAEVKASGVAYDGFAAIEAARVLITAVNANSKPADIDSLVKAGASLVQTAHDNPAIITALANGGNLSAVLSTASGKTDPVAVVQALASIGKAALTDSAGLNKLLQGGGMAGLLDSLPAGTSVKDVTAAVSNGGLSAGAGVANPPPVEVPPTITPTIAFVGPDGKDLPADTTLVANSIWYFIAVHGKPSGASTTFEVSSTGKANDWKAVMEDVDLADGTYFVRYVVKDGAGNSGTSNALKLVMDHSVPFLNVALAEDTGSGAAGTTTDRVSSNGAVKISGLHANETWTYSFDGKSWINGTTDANGMGTIAATGTDGVKNLTVRTLENVDGKSQFTSTAFKYTLDTTAPGQGLQLVSVGGTAGSHANQPKGDVVFSYTGTIDATKAEALFYRINTGTWSTANNTIVDNVKKTVTFKDVDLSHGPVQIVIQTKDAAGNVLDLSTTVTGTADTTPPAAPTVALVADSGPSATDHITNNSAIKVSGLEAGSTWEFSTDNGTTWKAGSPVLADGTANLNLGATGAQTLLVHAIDAAKNVSPNTTFEYKAYNFLNGFLSVTGKFGSEITSNTKGLTFSVMLSGHSDGVSTAYQISTTGKADDFTAWDAGKNLADGTYYFRAAGSDLAGNAYTSNTITVHLDNTAPAAPAGVKLEYDTGVKGDGITQTGSFIVSGIEKGALWQYSSDGKIWYQGAPAAADGTATGYAQLSGEQTLQVRTYDLAGNTSDAVSLHFTLEDNLPALGLTLNDADPTSHLLQTSQAKLDLVFSYTGTINAGDSFDYTPEFTGDDTSTWTRIDSAQIDTVHKTITIRDFDLSAKDVFLTLRGTDVAGNIHYQASIDGPTTTHFTQTSAAGLKVMLSGQYTAHLYLTDGSNPPVQVKTLDASGDLVSSQNGTMVGAQAVAVQGVLGAGTDEKIQTVNDKAAIYAFGTATGDTLSGNDVWGFGGDDIITAAGSAKYNSAFISGGMGADTIHTETSSSQLLYAGSAESFLAADDAVAHGFDTVYLSNDTGTKFTDVLNFEDIKLGDFYKAAGPAGFSGSETGSALLAALEKAVTGSFKTGADLSQAALVSFGTDGAGHDVNFLVVDADKDGHVGSADYVVKIVGSIGSIGASYQGGMFFIDTLTVA